MSKGVFSYLPKHFWYDGMFKIKAGKGYLNQITGETELVGVPGGPCKECEGTIISVKICTSVKGFETTTEKVCDTCGLVYPTSFQVLEHIEEDYRTPYYDSHEAWKEAHRGKMQGNPEDISIETEMYEHATGRRLNTYDDVGYSTLTKDGGRMFLNNAALFYNNAFGISKKESMKLAKALNLNSWKSEHWNRDKEDVLRHRYRQYYMYIDICKSMFDMHKDQVNEVKDILDNRGNEFNTRYDMEDIILCLCIYVKSKSVNNGRMSVIKRQIPAWKDKYSTLYNLIVQKMDS